MSEQLIDFYAILEVEPTATEKEIKNSFRRLSKKYHPDVSTEENAAELFDRVHNAYKELGDPESKKLYDEFVKREKEGKNQFFDEIFKSFHSGITSVHAPVAGEDLQMEVLFKASEVRQGAKKTVEFERYCNCVDCEGHGIHRIPESACKECRGHGYTLVDSRTPFGDIKKEKSCGGCAGTGYIEPKECTTCKGKGKRIVIAKIEFTLPEETTDKFKITLKGKGDEGLNNGKPGDLIVICRQDAADEYQLVTDYDLVTTIDVPFEVALKGGKVDVKVPRGEIIKTDISQGTQPGHSIFFPDEGLLNPNNGFYGTLTCRVNVLMPREKSQVAKLMSMIW